MNNIILFEIKNKLSIIITISIVSFILLIMYIGLYPTFSQSISEFNDLIASMPKVLTDALDMDINSFVSFSGYYVFTLSIISIAFASVGAKLAFMAYTIEKTKHLGEYLYVKPISKKDIFLGKYLSILLVYLICSIIFYLFSLFMIFIFVSDFILTDILVLNLAPVFIGLVTLHISILIAVLIKRAKVQAPYLIGIVLTLFMLSFLVDALDKDYLSFISPFSVFNTNEILNTGISSFMILYLIIVSLLAFVSSIYLFKNKEVRL